MCELGDIALNENYHNPHLRIHYTQASSKRCFQGKCKIKIKITRNVFKRAMPSTQITISICRILKNSEIHIVINEIMNHFFQTTHLISTRNQMSMQKRTIIYYPANQW